MHLDSDREVDTPKAAAVTRRGKLLQVLGTWESAAIGIGVAIGAGIFRTPGYVAGFLDTPWQILAVWVIGGLLVLRSEAGYMGPESRLQLLQNKQFVDARVEIFGKHGSRTWQKLGEYKIDRQLLTQ